MRQKQVKKKACRRLEKKVNSQCAALQILAVKCGISKVSKSWMEMKRRFQLLYRVITKNLPRCRLFFLRRWSDFFAGVHLWQQAINVAINFTFFFKTTREKSQCVLNKKPPLQLLPVSFSMQKIPTLHCFCYFFVGEPWLFSRGQEIFVDRQRSNFENH